MGSSISHSTSDLDLESMESIDVNGISLSHKVVSLVPDFNSHDIDINTITAVFVAKLIEEAEKKLRSSEYGKYLKLLQRATQLGSACAAAKLGVDITLLLDVVIGLTDLYRSKLNNRYDEDIINHGVKLMRLIDDRLQDLYFIRILNYKDVQQRRAIRIHINFCIALTAMAAGDVFESAMSFQECLLVGECGFSPADKLVQSSQTNIKLIESSLPRIPPICVQCEYAPKNLKEIWKLLVCPQCKDVGCCGKDCLEKHMSTKCVGSK
ncbi:11259_t:CDS:2 [Diversispora eburnea]|uniref:11259_t:CDS:1 n=1 Tax=Diversispora eburnea TaxID=1213867 RepID=A0A9N8VUM6_9GLOM|nr:11259_t:CDS:2 [Diversispora eburnea]